MWLFGFFLGKRKIFKGIITSLLLYKSNCHNVRLMHWNTQWFFTKYNPYVDCPGDGCVWKNEKQALTHLSYISNIINKINPDILNICEIQGEYELKQLKNKTNKNYNIYWVNGTDYYTRQTNALLSLYIPKKIPERILEKNLYPISNSKCGYNGKIKETDIPKNYITEYSIYNNNITFISLHLPSIPLNPTRCAVRESQAQIIQNIIYEKIIKGNYIIIVGDLNDFDNKILDVNNNIPTSKVLDILKGYEGIHKNKYKLFSVSDKIIKNNRVSEVFDKNNTCYESMIDHVLLSNTLYKSINNVSIFNDFEHNCSDKINWKGYFNSDHNPIVIDFQI
jgi:exonuclease III